MFVPVFINECVLYSGFATQYAIAFFNMSLSSLRRRTCFSRRAILDLSSEIGLGAGLNSRVPSLCFFIQLLRVLRGMPRSAAIFWGLVELLFAKVTASFINSESDLWYLGLVGMFAPSQDGYIDKKRNVYCPFS